MVMQKKWNKQEYNYFFYLSNEIWNIKIITDALINLENDSISEHLLILQ